MTPLQMALSLLVELIQLIPSAQALIVEIEDAVKSIGTMQAENRGPTADEIAAQQALITKLQAQLDT